MKKKSGLSNREEPLVSCLCVTEKRQVFMPWLLWCYDRQIWPLRELVIVDSSRVPLENVGRDDVRIVRVAPGTGVAEKRNIAIQNAAGDIITWFDDDDWQHPNKLRWIVEALTNGASYVGSSNSWFVDLYSNLCAKYHINGHKIIFNSAGFLKSKIHSVRFNENIHKASDTHWMRDIERRFSDNNKQVFDDKILFFWLCHNYNLSNPAWQKQLTRPLDELKKLIGPEAWGNTDEELDALRSRLSKIDNSYQVDDEISKHRVGLQNLDHPSHQPKQFLDNSMKKNSNSKKQHPVGLMIKATIMDAPFLDVMVRHMISQMRYSFVERMVVVDRQPTFSGKYHKRSRLSNDELDLILEKLVADGIVDRVLDVDMNLQRIQEIMRRYFITGADCIPTHASTGGPIYATLFGMESVNTDYVLQMDADIFFYTKGVSWIKESLNLMEKDEQLWLMMTHPGPPAGPPGKSLGIRNARLSKWDPDLQIYRFSTATTRYFLCDRRRLRDRLRPVQQGVGCAPLEQCISHALKQYGAFRGALGNLESWHLHAWYHDDPFPQLLPFLAKAIEFGKYPPLQKGKYDLRLDIDRDRREWQKILKSVVEDKTDNTFVVNNVCAATENKTSKIDVKWPTAPNNIFSINKDKISTSGELLDSKGQTTVFEESSVRLSPLAVIIPVRNRSGQHLKNTLASLNWQSIGRPKQVVVVSFGSSPEINKELTDICLENSSTLITIGDPNDPWNKPYALNVGIQATKPEASYLMTMDADMILAPNFVEVVLKRLKRKPPGLVLCRSSDLPQKVCLPENEQILMNEFDKLQKLTSMRPEWGPGGIQAAQRSFFFDIRGYDEDLLWWGAMDRDMVSRAKLAGLTIEWVEDRTAMLHQWHPRKYKGLKNSKEIEQAKKVWKNNHELVRLRSATLKRNPTGWGEIVN